ncbi:PKD domain-containing protein [Sorangium sp. So ce295]|uniref:PKD domain-containing protein n=1 Tax=Sorangium sp. So ce295 TaxID=3133295 RepID=UPI003F62920C
MRSLPTLFGLLGGLCAAAAWPAEARAVTASVPVRAPSLAGEAVTFDLTIGDAVGPVQVRWDMGDETRTEFMVDDVQQVHTYAAPGHYPVLVTVKDDVGFTSVAFVHTAHRPLVTGSAAGSTDLVYDPPNAKVYTANYENDSVSVLDASALTKVAEVPVARGPVGLALTAQGTLWVLHRDAHSVSILDAASLSVEREIALPYASQPMGLAISPTGDAAYVTLMAVGKVLKLDVASGAVVAELWLGGTPRGVSVSHDGSQIYVTRFLSEDSHGEVARIDAATFQVSTRFALAADTTTEDTDQQGRGLPNYLFSVGLSPDGSFAWVPGKKDNIFRGPFRDGLDLTDDNTVRPLVALLNLAEGAEDVARRIDLDDRNLPNQVVFTPLGDYAFISVAGSALVEVRDAYSGEFVTALKETGFAPRGLALTETNKLFVHASLSRTVTVYDVADIVSSHDLITKKLTEIPTVAVEKLDPQVLRGKQLFFNSADIRMSDQGYISCASCHFDGAEDGRVWDFGSAGEGLRNTVSLLGRRGTGHGNVNWSGSFDEIQDSDDNIRHLFGGKGFLTAEQLAVGAVGTPRGDKKAGLSPELDALAAFLGSLDTYRPSPFRNPDGSLTQDGVAGRAIFKRLGCGFCHTGPDGTDSVGGKLHDVGTVKASSGMRAGEPLFGIDTPTLNGVWEAAPYLHDGSAPTLRDVLVTANPDDRHAFISGLSEAELGQLIAYVQQLDGTVDAEAPSEDDAEAPSEDGGFLGLGCSVTGGRSDRRAPLLAFALVASLMTFGARRRRPS